MALRKYFLFLAQKYFFNMSGMNVKFYDEEVVVEKRLSQENGSEECLLEWCGVVRLSV